jgi:ribosomal protein S18 acetylase RimI-like enzyme
MLEIRQALPQDAEKVWEIIQQVISSGDTYVFAPDSNREKMLNYWYEKDKYTYVALWEGEIVGTFWFKSNQPDLGSHIANAAYMTSPKANGQGIGKAMGEFSIQEARRLGYRAMQFNIVVKTNERAVNLWQKLGFSIIGEIPEAFNHQKYGLVNAYIMYQKISD